MNSAQNTIQDFVLVASDINNEEDLIANMNKKLVEPFFEALFSLEDEEVFLKEQGILALNRYMKTHYIDEHSQCDENKFEFYSLFIPFLENIFSYLKNNEIEKENYKQIYLIQLWCECVYLIVHSHQKEIIEKLCEKKILNCVMMKLNEEVYKKSTVMIKSVSKIISEMISMKMYEEVFEMMKETGVMKHIVENYKTNVEMKCFMNEILHKMLKSGNEKMKELLIEYQLDGDSVKEEVEKYDEELHKNLVKVSMFFEASDEFEDDDDEYDEDYDDDDDDDDDSSDEDSSEELDDDIALAMEDFFESVKNDDENMLMEVTLESAIPDMKDDPLMPKDLPVFSKKFEHMYDEVNRQDNLFV